MNPTPDSASHSSPVPPLESIAARVRQRLELAHQAFERRQKASRPGNRRRKPPVVALATEEVLENPLSLQDRAGLRSVFRELGDAHRRYRAQTGHAGTPALRAAAFAFKREPSVGSLIPVAAYLDELGILAW